MSRVFQYVIIITLLTLVSGAGYAWYSTQAAARMNATKNSNLTNGLVGLWSFDGADVSGTTAYDRSGQGNNGTLTNSPTVIPGKLGQALDFNGTTQYISVADPVSGALDPNYVTVSAWIKPAAVAGDYYIVSKGRDWWSDTGYNIHIESNKIRGEVWLNTAGTLLEAVGNTTLSVGSWYHVNMTFDGSNVRVYVNGIQDGISTNVSSETIKPSGWNLIFSSLAYSPPSYFTYGGSIDEVRIYNRALSESEVRDLYQLGASDKVNSADVQADPLEKGLTGYWKLDENTGTTAADASGNGNTGTLTNGPTWTTGRIGSGVTFDGTNDEVTTTNAISNPQDFTVSVWFKTSTASGKKIVGFESYQTGEGSGSWDRQIWISTGGNVYFGWYDGGGRREIVSANTYTDGAWHHAVGTHASGGGGTGSFYVDGVLQGTDTGVAESYDGYWRIGGWRNNFSNGLSGYFIGSIDETRIYNRALSADEVAKLYQTTTPDNPDTSLKGYWSFDGPDVSGTTAYDRSGQGNNGTLTNSPRAIRGKLGQALSFWPNGSDTNAYVNIGDPVSGALDFGSGDFAVGFWMKSSGYVSQGSSANIALSKKNNDGAGTTGYGFMYRSGNAMELVIGNGTTDYTITAPTATTNDNQWHHYMGFRSGSTMYLYIDGVQVGLVTVSGSVSTTTGLYVGSDSLSQRNVNGNIDDVHIYSRALSEGEIRGLYQLGASDKFNSADAQTDPLEKGLTGYWKLDENTGTTAADASGNSNTGTLTNGPTWGTGRIGSGVTFDGVDDYVIVPYNSVLSSGTKITYSLWVKPDVGQAAFLGSLNGENGSAYNFLSIDNFGSEDGNPVIGMSRDIGGDTSGRTIQFAYPANQWFYLVYTYDGSYERMFVNGALKGEWSQTGNFASNTEYGLILGKGHTSDGSPFKGVLDEVRVYNRALSADEVVKLYQTTTPDNPDTSLKGYWSFDGPDVSGTTAYDRSGQGNNGTLTNGPRAIRGKLGQALSFDGVSPIGGYCSLGDPASLRLTGSMTLSAWVYPTRLAGADNGETTQAIITKSGVGGSRAYMLTTKNDGAFLFNVAADIDTLVTRSTNTSVWEINNWYLVTGVYNASAQTMDVYVNGVLNNGILTGTVPASQFSNNGVGIDIGGRSVYPDSHLKGSVDDVRIYNRALTATEVASLYNTGK